MAEHEHGRTQEYRMQQNTNTAERRMRNAAEHERSKPRTQRNAWTQNAIKRRRRGRRTQQDAEYSVLKNAVERRAQNVTECRTHRKHVLHPTADAHSPTREMRCALPLVCRSGGPRPTYQDLEQSWMVLGPVGEEFRLLDWLSERLSNPPIRPLEL